MALTKKNIIVGAARVYLGPTTSTAANVATSKPAYVGGQRYSTTLAGANGLGPAQDGVLTSDPTVVGNWKELGFTQNGLQVVTTPTWADVQVDQLLDSAKIFKDGMTLDLNTTLAEATLENLLMAWGQASTSVSSLSATEKELTIAGGALGDAPNERGLIAIGNATENAAVNSYGERVYQAWRVVSIAATTIANDRSLAATIPVTFRALPIDNGNYGTVRDRLNVT